MKLYRATISDVDDLVELRIDFLKMEKGDLSAEDETAIRKQSKIYFEKHLPTGYFMAVIAKEDDTIASVAFLVLQERPANPLFLTGKTGTLLNVLTYPSYRKRGLATQVISTLIEDAKNLGVASIDLMATEDGRTVYEKLGFTTPPYVAMRLKLLE